jgi:hypothetical protein
MKAFAWQWNTLYSLIIELDVKFICHETFVCYIAASFKKCFIVASSRLCVCSYIEMRCNFEGVNTALNLICFADLTE